MSDNNCGKACRVLELPLTVDIRSFSYFLYSQGILHNVTEESGVQVVWAVGSARAAEIEKRYKSWVSGELVIAEAPKPKKTKLSSIIRKIAWRQYPVTLLFMVVSIIVALVSRFGSAFDLVSYLTFVPFKVYAVASGGATVSYSTLESALINGQYWRLITPIFLHFSEIHLVFNMLWLFDLGKRIEAKEGGVHLFLLILATGIASNFMQYSWVGIENIFGGFSGVVFGLLGYCMFREKVDKSCQFGILPALYKFMLIYLVIGYTGILDFLAGGSIANAAHTGGLLAGAFGGILSGFLLRKKEGIS